jgi:transcriptional regulator with XRE-family HTH domain
VTSYANDLIVHLPPAGEPPSPIADLRESLGLSRTEAARYAGISPRQLARIEADEVGWTPASVKLAQTYLAASVLWGVPLTRAEGQGAA